MRPSCRYSGTRSGVCGGDSSRGEGVESMIELDGEGHCGYTCVGCW